MGNDLTKTIKGFINKEEAGWKDLSEGIKIKVLGYDEGLMMTMAEFIKGAVGSIHTHPHRQVTYIVRGRFEVQIEDEKKVLKEGDSFFVSPSLIHGVVALEEGLLIEVFSPYREDFLIK